MDIVTLVNRTSKRIEGTFDGRTYVLGPHEAKPMLANAAEKVMEQNPQMGSEDPADPRSPEFLCGVKEWGHDISPLEQTDAIERFDRSLVENGGDKATTLRLKGSRASRVKVASEDDNPVGIQTV
jgi:hypothetical protein